ncbi:MAG: hypothetical protein ACI93P_002183, partial [bacterium]
FSLTYSAFTSFEELYVVDLTTEKLLPSWSFRTDDGFEGLVHLSSDSILCFGNFEKINGQSHKNMALIVNGVLKPIGFNVSSFNINDVVLYPYGNQTVLISGFGYVSGYNRSILKYNVLTNEVDYSFAPVFHSQVKDLYIHNDTIYCMGTLSSISGSIQTEIGALDINGNELDVRYDIGSSGALEVIGIENLLILRTRFYLKIFNRSTGESTGWVTHYSSNTVRRLNSIEGNVFVTGYFREFLYQKYSGLFKVRLDNETLVIDETFMVPIDNGIAYDIVPNTDGTAFIAGNFKSVSNKPDTNLIKIDISTGSTLPWTYDASITRNVAFKDIHIHNDTMYIASSDSIYAIDVNTGKCFWRFNTHGGNYNNGVYVDDKNIMVTGRNLTGVRTINSPYLVAYVPNRDSLFVPKFNIGKESPWQYIRINALAVSNDTLYFAGEFGKINGSPDYGWGMYNVKTGQVIPKPGNVSMNANTVIRDIEVDNSHIYLLDDEFSNKIHSVNKSTGVVNEDFAFANGVIKKLTRGIDGVYANGYFQTINVSSPKIFNVAKLQNGDVTKWRLPKMNTNYSTSFVTQVMETSNYLYVSGDYKLSGQNESNTIKRLNLQSNEWDPLFNVDFKDFNSQYSLETHMEIAGGRLFVGGDFKELNGSPVKGLSEVNLNYGFSERWQPKMDRGYDMKKIKIIKKQLFILNTTYADMDIDGGSYFGGRMQVFELDPFYHDDRIDNIKPAKGNNQSFVSATITGLGFKNGSTVMLRKGGVEIPVNPIGQFVENRFIQARLDFSNGAPLGFYDVVVKGLDGSELVLPNGFEIIENEHPVYYADLIGMDTCRVNRWTDFTIVIKNESYQDVFGVPVNLAVAENVSVRLKGNYFTTTSSDSIEVNPKNLTTIAVDSLGGQKFDGKVLSLVVPVLPANSEKKIFYSVFHPSVTDINPVSAWTDKALYVAPTDLDEQVESCFSYVAGTMLASEITDPNCVVESLVQQLSGIEYVLSEEVYRQYLSGWGSGMHQGFGESYLDLNAALDFVSVNCSDALVSIQKIFSIGWNGVSYEDTLKTICGTPFFPQPFDFKNLPVVGSIDPNDKTGPLGLFAAGILNNQEELHYRIRFENEPEATASAQVITIIDSLDAEVFDINKVVFTDVRFWNYDYHAQPGATFIDDKMDLRPATNLIAHISAKVKNGVITWVITALDPLTMELTTAPSLGILPPNATSPEGQGSVAFSVGLKTPIPDNLEIKNKAQIIFDENESIETNTYYNLIDKIDPVSTVGVLPVQTEETTFYIPIDGFDLESGVLRYDLYASLNGASYNYVGSTNIDSVYFSGVYNSTYRFYSIAIDSAGNVENKSTSAEAVVNIGEGTVINENELAIDLRLFPNPVTDVLNVELSANNDALQLVELFTLTGILVDKFVVNSQSTLQVQMSDYEHGIYLTRVTTERGEKLVRRIVKLR